MIIWECRAWNARCPGCKGRRPWWRCWAGRCQWRDQSGATPSSVASLGPAPAHEHWCCRGRRWRWFRSFRQIPAGPTGSFAQSSRWPRRTQPRSGSLTCSCPHSAWCRTWLLFCSGCSCPPRRWSRRKDNGSSSPRHPSRPARHIPAAEILGQGCNWILDNTGGISLNIFIFQNFVEKIAQP